MRLHLFHILLVLIGLALIHCEQDPEVLISSRFHSIKSVESNYLELYADGISSTKIVVIVHDNDGKEADSMKVVFRTTAGSLDGKGKESFDVTDVFGQASVELTSEASTIDINAEVTITVVDTAFGQLKKLRAPYTVKIFAERDGNQQYIQSAIHKPVAGQGSEETITIRFIGVTLTASIEDTLLPADGLSETRLIIKLSETTSQRPVESAPIYLGTSRGTVSGLLYTNQNGVIDTGVKAARPADAGHDTLRVTFGRGISQSIHLQYIIPKFSLSTSRTQTVADGKSGIEVTGTLLTQDNTPVIGGRVFFTTSDGIIPESALTNEYGKATVIMLPGREPNPDVRIIANYWSLRDTVYVSYIQTLQDIPNSILLKAEPNFIWVRETGNLEQTTISATVLGGEGQPVGNDFLVRFHVENSPGGGITIDPVSDIDPMISDTIRTKDGVASLNLRSGIRSGTVEISAELIEFPNIKSEATNIVIRSGPPYMWVDPANANNIIPHATMAVEPGKANTAFANPIEEIKISAIFGDKYNNPIEAGTAIYFTTTGGIITTDAVTGDQGQTLVFLQNVHPFPFLRTSDTQQLTSRFVPNPNDEKLYLDYPAINYNTWDFEGGEVLNTMGSTKENDGIALLLAYTWGENQNNQPIKVWTSLPLVFSVEIKRFTVESDRDTLNLGEAATIDIRLYDHNGNPVAGGSKLIATTNGGSLSETQLIPSATDWGYGTTYFQTHLINTLDPTKDKAKTAVVTLSLESPNGSMKKSVSVFLTLTEP